MALASLKEILESKRKSIEGMSDERFVNIKAGEIRLMLEHIDELKGAKKPAAAAAAKPEK